MKKFLKSLMAIVIVFIFALALSGCGKDETNNADGTTGGNNEQEELNDVDESNEDEVSLYSDDTKLVFDYSGVYKMVYYFSDDKITGVEYYFEYEDYTTAANSLAGIKANYFDSNVSSVTQSGKYVVVKFNEELYKDQTVQEVKDAYSFLQEIYEGNY